MFKVQLGVRLTPLNNFLNIDFAAQPNEQDRVSGDPNKLDNLIDANEVDEMVVNDSLDYLPLQARPQILGHWLTRLAHGGIIYINGLDLYEASRLIHLGQIDMNQANQLVYGVGKKSFCPPQVNVQIALQTGQMMEEKISYNGPIYTVILRRK